MSKYDNYDTCPKCLSKNEVTPADYINFDLVECKTKCQKCGHEDYWAYGFFNSEPENENRN